MQVGKDFWYDRIRNIDGMDEDLRVLLAKNHKLIKRSGI